MYLQITNATKIIDKELILDHINLKMEGGNIYGFKGKNGSGKTMLMKAICGLIRLSEGEIDINGRKLGKNQEFPESVGALIEAPGFINNYSGFKNLKILADIKGEIESEEVEGIMERIGLDPKEKKKVKKYSLGMKQKLGICAAIMEHPKLIILDEPTNALDSDSVIKLNEIIQEEKKRGALIIISSHDAEELEGLSDKIFVIQEGKIIKEYEVK